MTNTLALEKAIKESDFTKKELAEKLKLSYQSFYRRLKNITEFRASEALLLCDALELQDPASVFFYEKE